MNVGNRQFPYPVFNTTSELNCFVKGNFRFAHGEISNDENGDVYLISDARYETNSEFLKKLIDSGKAACSLIVECPDTFLRKTFKLTQSGQDIKLPYSSLGGEVSISCFVYAVEKIENYRSDDFEADFKGMAFELEKGDIIAIDDGYTQKTRRFDINKGYVPSIVLVSKKPTEDDLMSVEVGERKIKIALSPSIFDYYNRFKDDPKIKKIFFSMFLVPSLEYAINFLRSYIDENSDEIKTIDDLADKYSWVSPFCDAYITSTNSELTLDELRSCNSLETAQKVIGYATKSGVNSLGELISDELLPSQMRVC